MLDFSKFHRFIFWNNKYKVAYILFQALVYKYNMYHFIKIDSRFKRESVTDKKTDKQTDRQNYFRFYIISREVGISINKSGSKIQQRV